MEKNLRPFFGVIKGKGQEGAWSRGFRFVPGTSEETSLKGSLLINLELTSTEKIDLEQIGTQLVNSLQEHYYSDQTESILESLKGALTALQDKLKDILPALNVHNFGVKGAVAIIWGQFLYLGKIEGGSIILKRDPFFGPIQFNKIASGRLQDNDWLLLANDNFWTLLNKESLSPLLTNTNFDDSLQKIDAVVGEAANISCVIAHLQVEEDLGENDRLVLVDSVSKSSNQENIKNFLLTVVGLLWVGLIKVAGWLKLIVTIYLPWLLRQIRALLVKIRSPRPTHAVGGKNSRRRTLIIGVIVLLGIGLLGNLYYKGVKDKQAQAVTLVTQASQKLEEAKNIQTLNPAKAKSLLEEVSAELAKAKKLNPKTPKISALEKDSQDLLAGLRREYRLAELPLFYDLSFLKGGKISALALDKTNLYCVDDNGNLVLLDLKEKQSTVLITDPRLKDTKKILVSGPKLLFWVRGNLEQYDLDQKKFLDSLSIGNGVKDISLYNGTLYLLANKTLLKAPLVNSGALNADNYFAEKAPDLSSAQGLLVDGYVWVVTNGTVIKFSRGAREDFSISGLEKPWKNSQQTFGTENSKYLYIFDKDNNRVVVIDKEGSYFSQYISPQMEDVTGVLADEGKSRLYLAGKEKILAVDLK